MRRLLLAALLATACLPARRPLDGTPPPDAGAVSSDFDGGAPGDGGESCEATICEGACVDLLTNGTHCGECGFTCSPRETCRDGACVVDRGCQPACTGFTWCDVPARTCRPGCADDAACGPNGLCSSATHTCLCRAGFHRCGDTCEPDDSITKCGPACEACPSTPNGSPVCVDGRCETACGAGMLVCGGECLDCSDPNGTASCGRGGACEIDCDAGFDWCDGACRRGDATACGPACAACPSTPGFVSACEAGACVVGCAPGRVVCNGTCATSCPRTVTVLDESVTGQPVAATVKVRGDGGDLAHVVWSRFDGTASTASVSFLQYAAVGPAGVVVPRTQITDLCESSWIFGFQPVASRIRAACVVRAGGNLARIRTFGWSGTAWTGQDVSPTWTDQGDTVEDVQVELEDVYWSRMYSSGESWIGNIYKASRSGGGWSISMLEDVPETSPPFSILPPLPIRVAYPTHRMPNGYALRIATPTGTGGWTYSDATTLPGSSVKTGVWGGLQLAVARRTQNDIYFRAEATGWAEEHVATTNAWGDWAFVVGAAPHILFERTNGLFLATRRDGVWVEEELATEQVDALSLGVLGDGRPVAAAILKPAGQPRRVVVIR